MFCGLVFVCLVGANVCLGWCILLFANSVVVYVWYICLTVYLFICLRLIVFGLL